MEFMGAQLLAIDVGQMHCQRCAPGFTCVPMRNPGNGFLSFDTFKYSLIYCFTVITGEGWADTMYTVVDETSKLSVIFFLLIVLLGGYIGLNMLLAVCLLSTSASTCFHTP